MTDQLTEHFSIDEMKCPCCGQCNMDDKFMKKLEVLREKIGKPIHINSGFRCEKHNAELEHSSKTSYHMLGKAADICVDGLTTQQIANIVKLYKLFNGFGYGETFLHIDDRDDFCEWSYN